jgi:hypothetical protein
MLEPTLLPERRSYANDGTEERRIVADAQGGAATPKR